VIAETPSARMGAHKCERLSPNKRSATRDHVTAKTLKSRSLSSGGHSRDPLAQPR
jgi:hypothetical protein